MLLIASREKEQYYVTVQKEQQRGKLLCDMGHQKDSDSEAVILVLCSILLAPGKILPNSPGSP